jgi:hypothetical protein
MKKSTPGDPPEPKSGEVSPSEGSDPIPQAEIVTELEVDIEVLEKSDGAHFMVVEETTVTQVREVKSHDASAPSTLPRGRERQTSFTPEPSSPDRGAYHSVEPATGGHSFEPDTSPEETLLGPPPVLVLASAVMLLLVILALWR